MDLREGITKLELCVVAVVVPVGSLRFSCGVVPQHLCVKAFVATILVETWAAPLWQKLTREEGEAFVALVRPLWRPHLSNVDVLPKREELRETYPCLLAPLGYFIPFITFTHILLSSFCHASFHIVLSP